MTGEGRHACSLLFVGSFLSTFDITWRRRSRSLLFKRPAALTLNLAMRQCFAIFVVLQTTLSLHWKILAELDVNSAAASSSSKDFMNTASGSPHGQSVQPQLTDSTASLTLPAPGEENVEPVTTDCAINLDQPPVYLQQNFPLNVELTCSNTGSRSTSSSSAGGSGILFYLGVEVLVWTETQDGVAVFRHRATLDRATPSSAIGLVDDVTVWRRTVRLRLPRYIAYRPGVDNKYSVYVNSAKIRVWIAEVSNPVSAVKVDVNVTIAEPYDRPTRPSPVDRCMTSWWITLQKSWPYRPVCPFETEVFQAIKFPVALSGVRTGVHRVVPPYQSKVLRTLHSKSLTNYRFTLSLWLYVIEYCLANHTRCSVFQHFTWDDRFATPLVFLTNTGQPHIELVTIDGQIRAFTAPDDVIVPKNQWVNLVISCFPGKCNVTVRTLEKWNFLRVQVFRLNPNEVQYMDDHVGLLVFGGHELHPSFQGYIGHATFYRRRTIRADLLLKPDERHPMFQLNVGQRDQRCRNYVQQINYSIMQNRALLRAVLDKKSCRREYPPGFMTTRHKSPSSVDNSNSASNEARRHCNVYNSPRPQRYHEVHRLVRQMVLNNDMFSLTDLGARLVNIATSALEMDGWRDWEERTMSLLKQASCFGNHDATFMLSTILNHGLAVSINETQAHSHLLYGAMDGNRLCLMALGNKHAHGLDGIPLDHEIGYTYYKQVADKTKNDLDEHRDGDVITEMVRLTNEQALKEQTEEDGDLFIWFKHQSVQGVVSAQQNMARLLYWGAQGINRDVAAALEYYRLAAESGEPQALYDYGIVLLKGHGTKPNMTLAREQFLKAAVFNHSGAINALGWYAMEITRNNTEAAELFHRAHELGNKDASHNLGHMHLYGRYPGGLVDRVKAFEYLAVGALRGQYESGILIAMFNMRGHPKAYRDPSLALDWVRYVSERNPAVGKMLTRGVRAFRKRNWPATLVYYTMAASTGVEVANFNLAFICEEDYEGLVANMEKECVWRHYNLSTQRVFKNVHSAAWLKMADYYYYGYSGQKQLQKAAELYCNAAINGDPQGLYNLATMVEEGIRVHSRTWSRLGILPETQSNNITLTTHLYTRCKDFSSDTEAFLPCLLALYRVQAMHLINTHYVLLTFGVAVAIVVTSLVLTFARFSRNFAPAVGAV